MKIGKWSYLVFFVLLGSIILLAKNSYLINTYYRFANGHDVRVNNECYLLDSPWFFYESGFSNSNGRYKAYGKHNKKFYFVFFYLDENILIYQNIEELDISNTRFSFYSFSSDESRGYLAYSGVGPGVFLSKDMDELVYFVKSLSPVKCS